MVDGTIQSNMAMISFEERSQATVDSCTFIGTFDVMTKKELFNSA